MGSLITSHVTWVISDISTEDRAALETELEEVKTVLHSAEKAVRQADIMVFIVHPSLTYIHVHFI